MIQEGTFGYYNGTPPQIGENGKFQVNPAKVVFEKIVADDEIDLDLGFLIMPGAIPVEETPKYPPPPEPQPPGAEESPSQEPGSEPAAPAPGEPGTQKTVNITFKVGPAQLFDAWQSVANLADMAGEITVNISASSLEGFDKNKLRNAVIEPLEEADLID